MISDASITPQRIARNAFFRFILRMPAARAPVQAPVPGRDAHKEHQPPKVIALNRRSLLFHLPSKPERELLAYGKALQEIDKALDEEKDEGDRKKVPYDTEEEGERIVQP